MGPIWSTGATSLAAEDDLVQDIVRTAASRARRPLTMGLFYNIMLGYFFGFALGVGSALAVFYAIYSGGYRKAVEHSLLKSKPKRYLDAMASAVRSEEKRREAE
jgi:hypothetical protein